MTICNMAIEGGAKIGLIAPDEKTFEYVAGREYAPKNMEAAINDWKELYTDEDAHYDKVLTLDVNELVPFVTWGTNPEMGVPFDGTFPAATSPDLQKAYDYMDLNLVKHRLIFQSAMSLLVLVRMVDCLTCRKRQKSWKVRKFMTMLPPSSFPVQDPSVKQLKKLDWTKFLSRLVLNGANLAAPCV